LIQHAQAADRDANRQLLLSGQVSLPLTRHGRRQAKQLGEALADGACGAFRLSQVACSPREGS
jgi:broad specificity phosphatase PhoE